VPQNLDSLSVWLGELGVLAVKKPLHSEFSHEPLPSVVTLTIMFNRMPLKGDLRLPLLRRLGPRIARFPMNLWRGRVYQVRSEWLVTWGVTGLTLGRGQVSPSRHPDLSRGARR
jgi:hypothetical protein